MIDQFSWWKRGGVAGDRTQHHSSCRHSKAEPRKAEEENRAWEARGTRDPLNKDGSIDRCLRFFIPNEG